MMPLPFQSEIHEAFRTDRRIWGKIGVCGLIGALIIGFESTRSEFGGSNSPGRYVPWGLIGAALGVTIGMLLALRDVCLRRIERGRPVNPILKLYLGSRGHSQIAWLVTVFVGLFVWIWLFAG